MADWPQHKLVCEKLNVGCAQQLTHPDQLQRISKHKTLCDEAMRNSPDSIKHLFMIFGMSDDSAAALAQARSIFSRLSEHEKKAGIFLSLAVLVQAPRKSLKKKTSPLLIALSLGVIHLSCPVLLHQTNTIVDTLLCIGLLSEMGDPKNPVILKNQVVLAKQLIKAGADVNARTDVGLLQKLHYTLHASVVLSPISS
jgi:hypothetical protein